MSSPLDALLQLPPYLPGALARMTIGRLKRSADIPVRSNVGTLNRFGNLVIGSVVRLAADRNVRAPSRKGNA